ncbi:hypothetical protein [Austwickia chelonae]|uniref:hypothetical protein n=1 Tax=Austwickia chelonae TaxID=100225 RepID=UPI0013C31E7B|nr:hypothetical protein [Austwickia chelonae]
MTTPTLAVTAKRWQGGWELHIDGYGVTQSRTLDQKAAEREVHDYMTLETGQKCTAPVALTVD